MSKFNVQGCANTAWTLAKLMQMSEQVVPA